MSKNLIGYSGSHLTAMFAGVRATDLIYTKRPFCDTSDGSDVKANFVKLCSVSCR